MGILDKDYVTKSEKNIHNSIIRGLLGDSDKCNVVLVHPYKINYKIDTHVLYGLQLQLLTFSRYTENIYLTFDFTTDSSVFKSSEQITKEQALSRYEYINNDNLLDKCIVHRLDVYIGTRKFSEYDTNHIIGLDIMELRVSSVDKFFFPATDKNIRMWSVKIAKL